MLRRLAATVVLVVAFAAGCGGSADEAATPPRTETTKTTIDVPQGRRPAPAISGTSLDGESISLGDFLGRPVLVNVWSSW